MRGNHLGLLALACVSLASCDNNRADRTGASNMTSADTTVADGADDTADAASNTLTDIKTAITVTPEPQEFVDRAAESDAFEIAAAKIARSKARSAEVKQFADQMITDHTASTAKIKAAAAKATPPVTPHTDLTQDQQSTLNNLRDATAEEFDERYMSGQIGAHRDALALMQRYADSGTSPELKQAASEIAPVIQQHLDMARKIDDRLDK